MLNLEDYPNTNNQKFQHEISFDIEISNIDTMNLQYWVSVSLETKSGRTLPLHYGTKYDTT